MDEPTRATDIREGTMSRRTLLALGAAAALAPTFATAEQVEAAVTRRPLAGGPATSFDLMEATIAEMRVALRARAISSRDLTLAYLSRIAAIDKAGPAVNSIIEL